MNSEPPRSPVANAQQYCEIYRAFCGNQTGRDSTSGGGTAAGSTQWNEKSRDGWGL